MKNFFVRLHSDAIGFISSLACAIHCLFMPVLISLIPLIDGTFISSPGVETTMIILSFIVAIYALVPQFLKNHNNILPISVMLIGFALITIGRFISTEAWEIWMTSSGALCICLAHVLNWKILHPSQSH